MKGYWENPEATDKVLRPGPFPWEKVLHTGDLFRTDQEGFLYFVGRKDDIIKTRGEKVSPKEIENVLYALPGIREAAVSERPTDPRHAIKAVVASPPDPSPSDIIRTAPSTSRTSWCRNRRVPRCFKTDGQDQPPHRYPIPGEG